MLECFGGVSKGYESALEYFENLSECSEFVRMLRVCQNALGVCHNALNVCQILLWCVRII